MQNAECTRPGFHATVTRRSRRQRSEVRKPKAEGNPNPQIRVWLERNGSSHNSAVGGSVFGFRISFGIRDSVFGLLSGTLLFTTAVLAGKIVLCSRLL